MFGDRIQIKSSERVFGLFGKLNVQTAKHIHCAWRIRKTTFGQHQVDKTRQKYSLKRAKVLLFRPKSWILARFQRRFRPRKRQCKWLRRPRRVFLKVRRYVLYINPCDLDPWTPLKRDLKIDQKIDQFQVFFIGGCSQRVFGIFGRLNVQNASIVHEWLSWTLSNNYCKKAENSPRTAQIQYVPLSKINFFPENRFSAIFGRFSNIVWSFRNGKKL